MIYREEVELEIRRMHGTLFHSDVFLYETLTNINRLFHIPRHLLLKSLRPKMLAGAILYYTIHQLNEGTHRQIPISQRKISDHLGFTTELNLREAFQRIKEILG